MIHIVCDMNCNNRGNYFQLLGTERNVGTDKSSYIIGSTYYPKGHCYRVRRLPRSEGIYRYSEALDLLIPEDYVKWMKRRFGITRRGI